MINGLLEKVGIKLPSSTKNYIADSNVYASIYMSVIVIILETWMIQRMFPYFIEQNKSATYIIQHLGAYFIFLFVGVIMFAYAIYYLRHKKKNRTFATAAIMFFCMVALLFGLWITYTSSTFNIITLITMSIYVFGFYAWYPWVSILLVVFVHIAVYYIAGIREELSLGFKINFIIIEISFIVMAFHSYFQRLTTAKEKKNLSDTNDYLRRIATHDEITGIYNLHYFRQLAKDDLEKSIDNKIFLFIDLENFKSYNNKHGFEMGNDLLRHVAAVLSETFDGGLVARVSDDHFIVLCENTDISNKLASVSEKIKTQHHEVYLGIKVGAYIPSSKDENINLCCDHARYACGMIKKRYDEDFCIYDKNMDDTFIKRQYIVNNIDKAVANDYIKVFYQPIVDAKTGIKCGYEALARWQDPTYGMLSPGIFIPVLEEHRQIHKLDKKVVEIVCRDMKENKEKGTRVFPTSLNFSRLDFERMDVVGVVEEYMKEYDIEKDMLHIEVTESAMSDNTGRLDAALDEFRNRQMALWLDDFGSEYSSLNVLKDYSFDVLKIDMKFLSNMSEKSKDIIASIIKMAKSIGMKTLTEGVETEEQKEFLKEAGCEMLQGYFFGKPMPMSEQIK